MKKLILIDGNAILHRAYHALPPLTNKKGIVVNAVYGFFSMFLKILENQKPDFIIVCFDRPKPTFRKELFVGYQAKRPTMASDLVPQIKFVHDILEAAKIEIFEVDGYEADDLIGTLANQVQSSKFKVQSLETIIVSGDRDMLQLVNSHVKVLAPIKGITEMILFDENKVEEKYGIKSSQFIDYKALVGDSSDNYPGVAGVGPKTAAILINSYGSLEGIYKNLEKIKAKNPNLALKLANDAQVAGLAQKLAGIVLDAPITLDIEKASMKYFDKEGLKKEFETFGFKSLLGRLKKSNSVVAREISKNKKPANTEAQNKNETQTDNKQMELL